MAERNLDLNERVEASRDPHRIASPVQFELSDIKGHFDQSLDRIKNQYEVADSLKQDGKDDDCKNIWRSQIVFLEGILDFYLHEMSKYCLYKMFFLSFSHLASHSLICLKLFRPLELL